MRNDDDVQSFDPPRTPLLASDTVTDDDGKKKKKKKKKKIGYCLTGDAMHALLHRGNGEDQDDEGKQLLQQLIEHVNVFARTSPDQKEFVLTSLKQNGHFTLMCGDGTNDVGALKQAHVGVACLNRPDETKAERKARRRAAKQALNRMSPMERKRQEFWDSHFDQPVMVQLGDASIASPFTSKWTSLRSIAEIVQQGRCTLVTTLQTYKTLALNALVSAYSMSVLAAMGVKLGDMQLTVASLLIAGCFLFMTRAGPSPNLSPTAPQSRVFSAYMLFSIFGQFIAHLTLLLYAVRIATRFEPIAAEHLNLDADFKPTLVNSAVFLVSLTMQLSNFAVNYRSAPYMQRLLDNQALVACLAVVAGLLVACTVEMVPELNSTLELVPFPNLNFRRQLLFAMILNVVVCYLVERLARVLFRS